MVPILSLKASLLIVILCSFNLYLVKCDPIKNNGLEKSLNDGPIDENEKIVEMFPSEGSESKELSDLFEFHNLDYASKIKVLELFINELKRPEVMSAINKRNLLRSTMRDGERKRPGWELAYGRRRRAILNN